MRLTPTSAPTQAHINTLAGDSQPSVRSIYTSSKIPVKTPTGIAAVTKTNLTAQLEIKAPQPMCGAQGIPPEDTTV